MDEDKEKKNENIDNPEKLQSWIDNSEKFQAEQAATIEAQAAKIEALEAQSARLTEDVKTQSELTIIKTKKWEDEDTSEGRDYRFGKFLHALRRKDVRTLAQMGAIRVKGKNDDLKIEKEWSLGARERYKDQGTPLTGDDSGTDWAYSLPAFLYATDFLRTPDVTSEVIPQLTRIPMANRKIRYPTQGSTVFEFTYVTNEVTAKTEQLPSISYVDLECETFAGYVGVTDELMEDTFLPIGNILRIQAIEDLQYTIEEQALNGNTNPFVGALRNTSTNTVSNDSTSFTDTTWDHLRLAIQALTTKRKRIGLAWCMHPTVWDGLADMQDAQGRYYWDPARAQGRSAWGFPVLLSDALPSTSAANTAFILLGNLKYIYHGTRMGMEMKYFDQTIYAVTDDENFFRIRTRFADVTTLPENFVAIKTAT